MNVDAEVIEPRSREHVKALAPFEQEPKKTLKAFEENRMESSLLFFFSTKSQNSGYECDPLKKSIFSIFMKIVF